ncbi:hypothetical protein [Leptolyngbya sp. 7M]|uniref:hypothetical protein n=1 Tax=Leptolyngbya sp. 7M TaxID=2812896 RepID=UPI001B8CDD5F|nr:hypothetical protein [Leptolyngbya sp. 7M]QYO66286.1 hypothetical protein JVX88_05660 [Leptolyngbya sp. 7M]
MRHLANSVILAVISVIFTLNIFCQENTENLLKQRVTLQASQATFVYALGTLAQRYKLPLGLEKSSRHMDDAKINIDIREKPLIEALNLLFEQEPAYNWEINDGVLNVFPTGDKSEFLSLFLGLHIERKCVIKETNEFNVRKCILSLPEVVLLMKSKRVEYATFMNEPSSNSIRLNDNADLSGSNHTLRDYLNAIVLNSNRNTWVVEMVGKHNDKLLLSF